MVWLLLVLVLVAAATVVARRELAVRRARRLESANRFRLSRHAAGEDVTRFGEELTQLHVETLTTELDTDLRGDYERALDSYEEAKSLLRASERCEDVSPVTRALADGRFAMACVLARRDGATLPERRPPCFFNPAHGPARTDVSWAPPGGVEREIPVCFRCSERLADHLEPDVRRVRWGNRRVPWYQAGPAYAAYAEGYYGGYVRDGVLPAFLLGSVLTDGSVAPDLSSGAGWDGWEGPGQWADDGPGGAHDPGAGPGGWDPGGPHGFDVGGGFDLGGGGGDGGGGV